MESRTGVLKSLKIQPQYCLVFPWVIEPSPLDYNQRLDGMGTLEKSTLPVTCYFFSGAGVLANITYQQLELTLARS
jgi:hypothetical protein